MTRMDSHTESPTESPPRRRDPILRWTIGDKLGDIYLQLLWATRAVNVFWGDDTPREVLNPGQRLPHTYPAPAAYTLRLRFAGGNQEFVAGAQIVIRDHMPQLTLAADTDDPRVVVVRAPAELDTTIIIARYRVQWDYLNDPTTWDDFWGMPNASVRRAMEPGSYTARLTDVGTQWWIETDYIIPERSLDCEVTVTDRTATLTVTKSDAGKDLLVSWGDKTVTDKVTGTTATHVYPSDVDDTYLVQLVYADNSDAVVKTVTIPGGAR